LRQGALGRAQIDLARYNEYKTSYAERLACFPWPHGDTAPWLQPATETVKAFALRRTPFRIRLGAFTHPRLLYLTTLWFVHDHLGRRFAHFKLDAHFLDLRGLLFQLGRKLRSLLFELCGEGLY